MAGLGDVDGDQVQDFAVGSYGDDDNGSNAGSVRVFSGSTFAALYTIHGSTANARLARVARAGDMDGDGLSDVLISGDNEPAPNGGINNGLVRALHGADGHELTSFYGVNNLHIGVPIFLGDVDQDGYPEIAYFGVGIEVHSILDCAVSNECVALPNSAGPGALMSQSGPRSITTNQFTLIASGTPPHAPGRFFFGQNAAFVLFGNGFRCIGAPFYRLPVTSANNGTLRYTLDFTQLPAGVSILAGSTWRFQTWFRDVQPSAAPYFFNLSDALAVTFCP